MSMIPYRELHLEKPDDKSPIANLESLVCPGVRVEGHQDPTSHLAPFNMAVLPVLASAALTWELTAAESATHGTDSTRSPTSGSQRCPDSLLCASMKHSWSALGRGTSHKYLSARYCVCCRGGEEVPILSRYKNSEFLESRKTATTFGRLRI